MKRNFDKHINNTQATAYKAAVDTNSKDWADYMDHNSELNKEIRNKIDEIVRETNLKNA
jgi:hypothetical protein